MKQWRDTEYFVTEDGDVYRNGRKLLGCNNNAGYKRIHTSMFGKTKLILVHRMVAELFIPNPMNKQHVNHIDGNRLNNRKANLEWVTPKENEQHKRLILKNQIGMKCVQSKLTDTDVKFIRENYRFKDKEFNSVALSKKYGVTQNVIWKILKYESWKHVD